MMIPQMILKTQCCLLLPMSLLRKLLLMLPRLIYLLPMSKVFYMYDILFLNSHFISQTERLEKELSEACKFSILYVGCQDKVFCKTSKVLFNDCPTKWGLLAMRDHIVGAAGAVRSDQNIFIHTLSCD